MIVCHCNVICSAEIASAVEDALEHMPASAVTPAAVYERCNSAPDCGGCQFVIQRIIRDIAAGREAEALEDRVHAKSAS